MRTLLLGAGQAGHRGRKRLLPNGDPNWSADLVTLDFNDFCRPDVVWDLNNLPLPFADNEFDEIHAYHTLEHFGTQGDWRGFLAFFSEVWRILKPGGHFAGITPSAESVWALADPGHTRVIMLESLIFLKQTEYERQCGHTPMTDYRPFYQSDFDFHTIQRGPDENSFIITAVKPSRYVEPRALVA
ncbi:MAG: methyltransferase domain-containing protein [Terricaulis sp.]